MRLIMLLCIAMLSVAIGLRAQDSDTSVTLGLVGGGTMLLHQGSFTQLGSYTSCCPEFTSGTAVGGYIGGFATLPFSTRWRLHLRLIYTGEPGSFVSTERTAVADLRDTARVVQAEMTHELDASLSSVGIEPLLSLRVGRGFDLLAGARVATVLAASFQQTETLTKPDDYGSYLGAGRTWVNHQAEIPDASSLRAAAVLGARIMVPLRRDGAFFMAPEAFVHLPLTDVAAVPWKITELRLGVSVGWLLQRSAPIVAPPTPPIPPPVPPPSFPPTVANVMVVFNGQRVDSVAIVQTPITEMVPVLGQIYFDEGSSELPERYQYRGPITTPANVVYSVLSIIAERMQRSRGILTITGTTSSTPADQGLPLARQRAERIAQTLLELGVPAEQLRLDARRLPRLPTAAASADEIVLAEQENRRVDLTCTDPDVLAPYQIRALEERIEPESLSVRSTVIAAAGVLSVQTSVGTGSAERRYHSRGDTTTGAVATAELIGSGIRSISASVVVVDSAGRSVRETTALPVRTVQARSRAKERYRLMLFPFNSAELTPDHQRMLGTLAQDLHPNDTIRVIGLTDTMGADEHNVQLSTRRAEAVARALSLPLMNARGLGSQRPLLSNGLPEGRAYNRTVMIEIEKHSP